MVLNKRVKVLLCIVALNSNLALVYGSRSDEEYQRGEFFEERQILKPLVKPILIKRDLTHSKGYPNINSKNNQHVKYLRIPVEEGIRHEYSKKAMYPKFRGGPVYQVRTVAKNLPRPTHSPKVVYVVQPKTNEQPNQLVYHDSSVYPEVSSNYLSDSSPKRIPIAYKHFHVPPGFEDVVGSHSQYGGVDYSPHHELSSPYIYRDPIEKESGVMMYSDRPFSSVRTLPEFTGNELQTYPKYEYRTVIA